MSEALRRINEQSAKVSGSQQTVAEKSLSSETDDEYLQDFLRQVGRLRREQTAILYRMHGAENRMRLAESVLWSRGEGDDKWSSPMIKDNRLFIHDGVTNVSSSGSVGPQMAIICCGPALPMGRMQNTKLQHGKNIKLAFPPNAP